MDLVSLFALPIAEKVVKEFADNLLTRYKDRHLDSALGNLLPDSGELTRGISQLIREGEFDLGGQTKFTTGLLDKLEKEIERFQQDSGGFLDVTRALDRPTIKRLFSRLACGGSDRRPTDRGPVSRAPDPNATEPHVMRYKIESLPQLGATGKFADSLRALVAALESWYLHLNLQVSRTVNSADANLVISCEPLVGVPDNYLALTDVGPPNGRQLRMVFDQVERSWDATMLQATAAHEFGHALGIRHRNVPQQGQLMNDTLDANVIAPLDFDLRAAQKIWGPRRGPGAPPAGTGAVTPADP